MGQKASSNQYSLKKHEVREFMQVTHFDYGEIDALYSHFMDIASRGRDDRVIDKAEFQIGLGMGSSLFLDRLFHLFDESNKGVISFTEFIKGLSVLCTRGTLDEKIQFSFRIYDLDQDGKISKKELSSVLEACLRENFVKITKEQIGYVVESTFKQVDQNKDGMIDFDEYKRLVSKQPSILDNMTLDFQRVIEQRLESMKKSRKTIHHLNSGQE